MGLFGNKAEKAAQDEAAKAEVDRLLALPVAELAVEVMPAFGPDGMQIKGGHRRGVIEVNQWLFSTTSDKVRYRGQLTGATNEALQALAAAGLLSRRSFGGANSSASTYSATRLGEEALADGTVREHLRD